MSDDKRPIIIIKKIKKVAGGHHGGAWKVAYADFVTAMMAFFLLLWLLSTSPQEVLKGIADYFAPTIGLKGEKGIGFDGGETTKQEGNQEETSKTDNILFSAPTSGSIIENPENETDDNDSKNFITASQALEKEVLQDSKIKEFANQILIEETPEGLQIQIVDSKDKPMFKPGSAEMMPYLKPILIKISEIIKFMPNFISVSGYTTGTNSKVQEFDAWNLSVDRANIVRQFLQTEAGIDPDQIGRIVGKADRELIEPEDPLNPKNARIALLLLKNGISSYKVKYLPTPNNIK